jgi:uncharacterized protein YgfB (UPF0149 family)
MDTSQRAAALLEYVQSWIAGQGISCPETIYQMDRVAENSPEFIEGLCDIAGYAPSED